MLFDIVRVSFQQALTEKQAKSLFHFYGKLGFTCVTLPGSIDVSNEEKGAAFGFSMKRQLLTIVVGDLWVNHN